jgi:hypothetical protein
MSKASKVIQCGSPRREDAAAIMKLYRHLVEEDPTEAATPDEMLEIYLYLHSLEKQAAQIRNEESDILGSKLEVSRSMEPTRAN